MRLVKVDNHTFINVEKILSLQAAGLFSEFTYIYVEGDEKIQIDKPLYKVKKIIEDAMKEM